MGVSSAVLEALRESHEDKEEEDCCCCDDDEGEVEDFVSGLGSVASVLKSSRNFWISGSADGSFGAGLLEEAVAGLSSGEVDDFGEGEVDDDDAQSQPIVKN